MEYYDLRSIYLKVKELLKNTTPEKERYRFVNGSYHVRKYILTSYFCIKLFINYFCIKLVELTEIRVCLLLSVKINRKKTIPNLLTPSICK